LLEFISTNLGFINVTTKRCYGLAAETLYGPSTAA